MTMAKTKDFTRMNVTPVNKVYDSIEQGTSRKGQQGTASPEEAKERASQLRSGSTWPSHLKITNS